MKKRILSLAYLALSGLTVLAQPPAITSGSLVLQLDLNSGSGADNYDTETHSWRDLSDCSNDVSQAVAANAPTLVTIGGFNALNFDASAGQFLSNTDANCLTNPQSTIFLVRVANPTAVWQTYLSLISKELDTDEMAMSSEFPMHHTWSGNFITKEHPCYAATPDDKPVVLTGVFESGLTNSDLDFYVNNQKSTNTISTYGTPNAYYSVKRDIYIGRRLLHDEFMEGQIMEVLVYDAALSSTDIEKVNDYLKCKYNTNSYASTDCNQMIDCKNNNTGIADIKKTGKFSIHPNPATANVAVTFPYDLNFSTIMYTITDIQGRLIISGSANAAPNNSFSLNTSALVPGTYLLNISNNKKMLGTEIISIK